MDKKSENVILVNLYDEMLGEEEKMNAHRGQKLHRAFSVFLYHDNKMLIQRRAKEKYHSANLWSNTCCSHPRINEDITDSARRRLKEEAGIECSLYEVFSFVYFEKFEGGLSEYEYDHVFLGEYDGDFEININEASQMKWVNFSELSDDMRQNPEHYTTWFLIAAPQIMKVLAQGK